MKTLLNELEFLGKMPLFHSMLFILVDLFSSKVYTFPMRSSIRMERYYQKKNTQKKKKKPREDL